MADDHDYDDDYSAPMIKPSRKGLLHKKLGIPQGTKIPQSDLTAAEHSSSPALRKEAQFADNFNGPSDGGTATVNSMKKSAASGLFRARRGMR